MREQRFLSPRTERREHFNRPVGTFWLLALMLCGACEGGEGTADAGLDAPAADTGGDAGGLDAPGRDDASGADAGGCTRVTAGRVEFGFIDDVSADYSARLTPGVIDTTSQLRLLFERYTPGPDVGTFELGGAGPDGNYGSCAHCVVVDGTLPGTAYFADRGTLELRTDPYTRRLRGSLTNVRLVEVTVSLETRESTPVAGGACLELVDLQLDDVFPPTTWSCSDDDFADGASCHCACDGLDPDCEHIICDPGDPDPHCVPPLPIADCGAGDLCAFDPLTTTTRCLPTCDWDAGTACTRGVCVFDYGVHRADTCALGEDYVSSAPIGGRCAMRPFQRPCGIMDGFARGYCDTDMVCRPMCNRPDDCAAPTVCQPFFLDRPFGYCGIPVPTE